MGRESVRQPPAVRELFLEALELRDSAAQTALLDRVSDPILRARVEALLKSYRNDDFLASPAISRVSDESPSSPNTESPGTLIGRYKLLEQIGEGGFGVVYMAEQGEPVRRKVALKIIRLGMDTRQVIARFEAERQALAMMDHPNIAKVLDAGATETGRPYFVMELVRGIPITQFCEENRLTIRERLQLFIPVCQAIQHAHQKGVIHRDIKPSNVLVTMNEGVPHPMVIDFGVAKAIDQRLTDKTLYTRFAQMIGTPAYMSPEQAEMSKQDVDTRTDVYSLGILLYELLTGTTPFPEERLREAGYAEIQRIISQEEPVRPSTLLSRLNGRSRAVATSRRCEPASLLKLIKGDLDWIILKAIDKDRNRRYETTSGLAADLQRYLSDEPVTAMPPSTLYQVKKFVQRHRVGTIAGAGAFLSLLLGLSVALLGLATANRERSRADRRAAEAQSARAAAEAQSEANRMSRYTSDMMLVQRTVERGDLKYARELLDSHRPASGQSDLRGWEWRYFWGQTQLEPLFEVPVRGVDLTASADGGWLAVAGSDQQLHLVDIAERRVAGRLPVQYPEIGSIAIGGGGAFLAVASSDGYLMGTAGSVEVWGWDSHQRVKVIDAPFARLFFGAQSTRLYYSIPEGIYLLDLADPDREPRTIRMAGRPLAVSPDGTTLAAVSNTGQLALWSTLDDADSLRLVSSKSTPAPIKTVAFAPDGGRFATAHRDGDIWLWDTQSLLPTRRLAEHVPSVASLGFSPDGLRVVGCGDDRVVRVWEGNKPEGVRSFATTGKHACVVPSVEGFWVATVAADGDLAFWKSSPAVQINPTRLDDVYSNEFSHDGERMLVHRLGTLSVLDLSSMADSAGLDIRRTDDLDPARRICGFSPDDRQVITMTRMLPEGVLGVRRWDASTGAVVRDVVFPQTHGAYWLPDAMVSRDGRFFAHVDVEGQVRAFDAESGDLLATFPAHTKPIVGVMFCGDGRWLACCASDGSVGIWDTGDWSSPFVLRGHVASTYECVSSPDERWFATASADATVRLWNADTGECAAVLSGHQGVALRVAFCADGKTLMSGSYDRTLRFWHVATGRLAMAFELDSPVVRVRASQDGRFISARTENADLYLWRAPSLEETESHEVRDLGSTTERIRVGVAL